MARSIHAPTSSAAVGCLGRGNAGIDLDELDQRLAANGLFADDEEHGRLPMFVRRIDAGADDRNLPNGLPLRTDYRLPILVSIRDVESPLNDERKCHRFGVDGNGCNFTQALGWSVEFNVPQIASFQLCYVENG